MIGCGNLHYDSPLRVPLASVDQNSEMIGQRTAAILLGLIESKVRPQAMSVILEPSLKVRASTKRDAASAKEHSNAQPSGRAKNSRTPAALKKKRR